MPRARAILENLPETDQTSEGLWFLRFWVRRSSSLLAIAGGALFLVLPVAFLTGTVSIVYPLQWRCTPGSLCPLFPYRLPLAGMVPLWTSLGVIGILLGILALKLSLKPRVGVALGLAFSLGSIALMFWTVTLQILETLITTFPL